MAEAASKGPFEDYLRVAAKYNAETMRILEASARDIQKRLAQLKLAEGIGARVREAQLRLVLAEVRNEQASMWAAIGKSTQAGRKAAAEAAQEALEAISRVAYASLAVDAAEALTAGLKATARAGIDAAYARVPRALSEAVYRNGVVASGKIEDLIRRGITQGLSAKELAASVYQYVSPTTPGGASYAAMRLARTEINNAFHEQQIKAAKAPGVSGIKWNLSSSHPRPDECNSFAEQDSFKMGAGVYPINDVPSKPHPHCFCYLTYVTMDPKEFSAAMMSGRFDDEIRRRAGINADRLKGMNRDVAKAPAAKRTQAARQRTHTSGADPTVTPGKLKPPKRVNGSDLSAEAERDIFDVMSGGLEGESLWFDQGLYNLMDRQGFTALPGSTVNGAELDSLIGQGWREVWRGTQGGKGQTAAEAVQSYLQNQRFFPGTGIYGNGIYTSVDREVAEYYTRATAKQPKGKLMRMVISPDARIIDYHDLVDLQRKAIREFKETHQFELSRQAPHDVYGKAQTYLDMIADPGRFATMQGYDVISVIAQDDGGRVRGKRTALDQFVILNRSVVVVMEV